MQILSRYLLARFLTSFAVILVLLVLTIVTTDMLLHLDDLFGPSERGLLARAFALGLRAPARYLPILVPVAAFAACFVCFGFAARWLEVTAMKAGGISPLHVALPVLGVAAALSFASLLLNETVVVQAARVLQRHVHDGAEDLAFRRGSFWYHKGRTIYNVTEADPTTQTLQRVSVFELDERGRLLRSIHAQSAQIVDAGRWNLENATVRHFDPEAPASAPAFERLAHTSLEVGGRSELALLDANVSTLSLRDLREYIAARVAEGSAVQRPRTLLHERLTDPLSVLLFVALAVPLGLRVEETKSLAVPALQGVVLLILFFFARNFGSTLAAESVLPAAATPWTILALFAGYAGWRLARVPR